MAGARPRPAALAQTRRLFAQEPLARRRMLYGSDWSMIARLESHPAYLAGLRDFVGALVGQDRAATRAIMGENARRWLGLDRDGRQRRRLARFHGSHPVWERLTG